MLFYDFFPTKERIIIQSLVLFNVYTVAATTAKTVFTLAK